MWLLRTYPTRYSQFCVRYIVGTRLPKNIVSAKCRTLSGFSRYQGLLKVQRVHISPRKITWKRVATYTLGLGLSYICVSSILGIFLLELEDTEDVALVKQQLEDAARGDKIGIDGEDKDDNKSKGHALAHDYDEEIDDCLDDIPAEPPEGAWFLPLWIAKPLPPTFYTSEDPEWQSFVRLAEDKDQQRRIKNELCSMILKSLQENKGIERALGKNIKCKSYWLDIDYPLGPPPSYERYGLEWADDYIALLSRPVNSTIVKRVEKALWPSAVTTSALATFNDLFQFQYSKVKKALGIQNNREGRPLDLGSNDEHKQKTSNESINLSGGTSPSQDRSPALDHSAISWLSILPEYPQDDQRIRPGLALFRRKLSKKWKPTLSSPPAGSIFLRGLVEYRGTNATCTVEVAAGYIATESKWHMVLVNIKRVQPNVLWPRGPTRNVGKSGKSDNKNG